jgi:hypothetical protein
MEEQPQRWQDSWPAALKVEDDLRHCDFKNTILKASGYGR